MEILWVWNFEALMILRVDEQIRLSMIIFYWWTYPDKLFLKTFLCIFKNKILVRLLSDSQNSFLTTKHTKIKSVLALLNIQFRPLPIFPLTNYLHKSQHFLSRPNLEVPLIQHKSFEAKTQTKKNKF